MRRSPGKRWARRPVLSRSVPRRTECRRRRGWGDHFCGGERTDIPVSCSLTLARPLLVPQTRLGSIRCGANRRSASGRQLGVTEGRAARSDPRRHEDRGRDDTRHDALVRALAAVSGHG